MGAPKQRWTSEEEAALKAGVAKHGPGKWRTILRDPEFSALLRLRSNVDLKDKWRNLSVTAGGYGSREKARMALKKGRRVPKVIAEPMDVDTNNLDDVHNTVIDAKPLAMAVEPMQLESTPENSVARSMSASTLVTLTLTQIQLPSAIPLLPFQISFRIGLAHVFALQLLRIVAGLLFFKLFQAVSEVLPYWNGMETAMRFHVPAVDEPVLDVTVELEGFGNYRLISRNTKPNVDFSKLVAWCVDMIRQIPQVWLCRLKVSPEQR